MFNSGHRGKEQSHPPVPPDVLITADELAHGSMITHESVSSEFGIPVYWGELSSRFGSLAELRSQSTEHDDGINASNLPEIGMGLYDRTPKALIIALDQLAGTDAGLPDDLTGYSLTGGWYEEILLYKARYGRDNVYWTAHLARGPVDSGLTEFTIADAQNLGTLSIAFDKHLADARARNKFRIPMPLMVGDTVYRDERYGYGLYPFIPYGEINVDAIRITRPAPQPHMEDRLVGFMPFYDYALPFTDFMAQWNDTQESAARGRVLAFMDGGRDAVNIYPGTRMHLAQNTDLLTFMSLIYLFTGSLPRQMNINAGDFMGILSHNGFHRLALITMRLGLEPIHDDHHFYRRIVNQHNPLPPYDQTQPHMDTFSQYRKEELYAILADAERLIEPAYRPKLLARRSK